LAEPHDFNSLRKSANHTGEQTRADQRRGSCAVDYSETDWFEISVKISAIHSGNTFLACHRVRQIFPTAFVVDYAQHPGLGGEEREIDRHILVPCGISQQNVTMPDSGRNRRYIVTGYDLPVCRGSLAQGEDCK
jgi:hypothetical protein